MIASDINIEITVEVNGTRYVVEKDLDGPEDEFGNSNVANSRLSLADQMLEEAAVQVRKAMGVPTREY